MEKSKAVLASLLQARIDTLNEVHAAKVMLAEVEARQRLQEISALEKLPGDIEQIAATVFGGAEVAPASPRFGVDADGNLYPVDDQGNPTGLARSFEELVMDYSDADIGDESDHIERDKAEPVSAYAAERLSIDRQRKAERLARIRALNAAGAENPPAE